MTMVQFLKLFQTNKYINLIRFLLFNEFEIKTKIKNATNRKKNKNKDKTIINIVEN